MTRAFKFLAAGAIGRFSRHPWPVDGAWVAADGPLVVGKCGAHVCRVENLAHWLDDELWEIELAGDRLEARDCLVVSRARLVREVERWRLGGATRFAAACIERADRIASDGGSETRALVDDARALLHAGHPAVAAYTAAVVVARLDAVAPTAAYEAERAWQSAWIAREIVRDDFV